MTESWDGTERRATDVRFEKAMADVRALKAGVTDLADAVQIRGDTIKQFIVRVAVMLAVLFILQMVASMVFVAGLNRHMDRGHTQIVCWQKITPEQRASLGDLACK